ncbi:hypothetical protein V0M98_35075 (plasmid) [Pseudomonas silesiensis]|uniref:hypothetical protein n=1 Tax=Pseudomonas silesiensis TaxID=1853130 RepID=UPI0030D16FAE
MTVVASKNYLILQELCEAREGKYCPPAGVLNQRLDCCIMDDNTSIIGDEAVGLFLSSFGFQNEDLTIQGERTVGDLLCLMNDYWVNELKGKSSEHFLFEPQYLTGISRTSKLLNRLVEYICGKSLMDLSRELDESYRFMVHIDQGFVTESQDNEDYDTWSYFMLPRLDVIYSNSIEAILGNLPTLLEQSTAWHANRADSQAQLSDGSPGSIFGFSVQSKGKVLMYIPLTLNNELSKNDEYTAFDKSNDINRACTALYEIYASGPAPFEIDFNNISVDSGFTPAEIENISITLPEQWKHKFLATAFGQDLGM